MDGWVNGWIGRFMDGWMGGWVDRWMDEWIDRWRTKSDRSHTKTEAHDEGFNVSSAMGKTWIKSPQQASLSGIPSLNQAGDASSRAL